MKISEQGIKLIKYYEGLHDGDLRTIGLQPKECPAGIWTIGYGHALQDKKGGWLKGKEGYEQIKILYPTWINLTEEKAVQLLKDDMVFYEDKISSLKLTLKQNEFDALVSFIYNLGFGVLGKSTLLKRITSREGDIKAAFLMWVNCNGKPLPGLVKRRTTEATLFVDNKLNI